MITGTELIAAERQRQIDVKGWTHEHDDANGGRVLWEAAECYEACKPNGLHVTYDADGSALASDRLRWPWEIDAWKSKTAPENLIRAGALFRAAAECFRRTLDDRPNKRQPLVVGETEADYVRWVLWLADTCEGNSVRVARVLDEWLTFASQVIA